MDFPRARLYQSSIKDAFARGLRTTATPVPAVDPSPSHALQTDPFENYRRFTKDSGTRSHLAIDVTYGMHYHQLKCTLQPKIVPSTATQLRAPRMRFSGTRAFLLSPPPTTSNTAATQSTTLPNFSLAQYVGKHSTFLSYSCACTSSATLAWLERWNALAHVLSVVRDNGESHPR
ncbi:hypothetical protein R3P38DRAFT_2791895 [Favolaschia claudopus]|uniref:Uncharacterized protein n=1 Tax=Favolaschia claudopus TaxID=2862362 RepID=A0AAW0AG66_9AGAR